MMKLVEANKNEMTFMDLLTENTQYIRKFKDSNPLIKLINSHQMQDKATRDRLLSSIQVFSDYFQKAIMLRNAFCDHPDFLSIAREHLYDEFGHNLSLLKDRNDRPPIWDAILESTSSWFCWKMFTSDHEEKIVLIHLVLEASANAFFSQAHQVMSQYKETNYFEIHADADPKHERMGEDMLKDLSSAKYTRLFEIQKQAWEVINAACERMAQLTVK